MKELVSIVIPIPEPDLSPMQERMLHHCLEALARYPVIFITFDNADLSIIREHKQDIDVVYFPKEYFESRETLAKLFLMEDFYDRLSWADYLLIHELNSWVVKDELYYWCKQGYDYIKASPVAIDQSQVHLSSRLVSGITGLTQAEKLQAGRYFQDNGLYLCKVQKMIETLKGKQKIAYQYRHQDDLINRDAVFWETETNRFWPQLQIPTRIVRNYFAKSVLDPSLDLSLSKEKLPFALTGINSKNITGMPYFD
jgi:hypothetical protein